MDVDASELVSAQQTVCWIAAIEVREQSTDHVTNQTYIVDPVTPIRQV